MDFLFSGYDDQLLVNGQFVRAQDIYRGVNQRVDEDDTDFLFTDDCTDVDEVSEPENEDNKDGPIVMTPKPGESKTPSEEDDPSPENAWKGKEKERQNTPTPEPHQGQNQAQGMGADLLYLILARQLGKEYGNFQYAAIEEPRVPGAYREDFEDANFVPPMFASHFMTSFRSRVPDRRPQPEFVTGPSRITLDDL